MRPFLIWFLYFISIFTIGVFSQNWGPDVLCTIDTSKSEEKVCKTVTVDFWTTSADEFATYGSGMGDVTNYLWMAQYYLGKKELNPRLQFALANWPPATPFIISLVLKFTGPDFYFVKMLLVTAIHLGFAFMLLFYSVSIFNEKKYLRFICILALMSLPNFRFNTVVFGYFASESIAISTFLISLVAIVRAFKDPSFLNLCVAGVCLGFAGYTRALLETLILTTLLFFCAVSIFAYAFAKIKRIYQKSHSTSFSFFLKTSSVMLISYVLTLHPWKSYMKTQTGQYTVCATTDSVYHFLWSKSENMPGWISTSNVPCRISPDLCNDLHRLPLEQWADLRKQLTIVYFFTNWLNWISYRLGDFNKLWTGYPYFPSSWQDYNWFMAWLEGIFFLFVGFFGSIYYFLKILRGKAHLYEKGVFFFILSFILVNIAAFTLIQYENRYSLFWKIAWFLMGLQALSKKAHSTKMT